MKRARHSLGSVLAWLGAGVPLLLLCAFASGILGSLTGLYLAYSKDLPSMPDLRAYRPKTVSTFYAEDGSVIGLFYKEKRFPIDIGILPEHVLHAFLAAEDARFFSHAGLDFHGIVRAFVRNVKDGNFSQGGSTITQQVTRNLLLSKEKKISRKVREAILAYRIEKTLSKKEILGLYLNEIYLGKGSYGLESAAGAYFGKNAKDLSLAEAAFIAGLAANPTKFSQQKNLEVALKRKDVVLARMARSGFISDEEHRAAIELPLNFREELPSPFEKAPFFTEVVRQYIVSRYGENRLYNDGLQVWTTCDMGLQQSATESLLKGARAWERRQGRPRGLVKRLDPAEAQSFLNASRDGTYSVGDVVFAVVLHNETAKRSKRKKNDTDFQECVVGFSGNRQQSVRLPVGAPYRPHDLVKFKVIGLTNQVPQLELYDIPSVQGAVVCIENKTGFVKSIVGGLDFEASHFNRATQALRQPGSAFKPIIFAAALQWAGLVPQTLVIDEPIAVISSPNEPPWIPANSDQSFQGVMPLSQALAHSRNIAAVKVFMEAGPDRIIQTARDMGIHSRLGGTPSLSLGASEVSLLELTGAYTVFPNMGMRLTPVMVKKVVDRFGRVLEDNTTTFVDPDKWAYNDKLGSGDSYRGHEATKAPSRQNRLGSPVQDSGFINELRGLCGPIQAGAPTIEAVMERSFPNKWVSRGDPERVLSHATAYLMVRMLQQTCVNGTAGSVAKMRRSDLAGKTGTTDDCTDGWFIGFNPSYTTGVWLGYDAKLSLGKREYGSVAALPVWMDFMKKALQKDAVRDYPVPPDMVLRSRDVLGQGLASWVPAETEPEFFGNQAGKPVVSIDASQLQSGLASPYGDYYYGGLWQSGQVSYTAHPAHYDSFGGQPLRLLSPGGEDLGVGVLARDEKGRPAIMRLTDSYQERAPWEPPTWRGRNQPYSVREAPHWEGPIPYHSQPPYQGIVR